MNRIRTVVLAVDRIDGIAFLRKLGNGDELGQTVIVTTHNPGSCRGFTATSILTTPALAMMPHKLGKMLEVALPCLVPAAATS